MKRNNSIIKTEIKIKPRNHVNLAMSKRNGAGEHIKTHKANRVLEKAILKKTVE